jgi:hypothetical protein
MMPDAQAPNPYTFDWTKLIEILLPLIPIIVGSLAKKSEYAKAHGIADPQASFWAWCYSPNQDTFDTFLVDYSTVRKAMATNP